MAIETKEAKQDKGELIKRLPLCASKWDELRGGDNTYRQYHDTKRDSGRRRDIWKHIGNNGRTTM